MLKPVVKKLSSERVARRFVLQLQAYLNSADIPVHEFVSMLGIAGFTWHAWKIGKIKKIGLTTIREISTKLGLNYSYIVGATPPNTASYFTQFVEFNDIYKELLVQGDTHATVQMIRKAAIMCYDLMVIDALPVVMTITNIAANNSTTDDLIVLDCTVGKNVYRLQLAPGLDICYCFGVIDGVNGQRVLHEGVLSMSIILSINKYILYKINKDKVVEVDDSAQFVEQARAFARQIQPI